MQRSTDRILTTHAGSLPRPAELISLYASNADRSALEPSLRSAVGEVVGRQVDAGIDVVGDGEFGKPTRSDVDFGAWWSYVYERLAGFEVKESGSEAMAKLVKGSKDRSDFDQFYADDGGLQGGGSDASAAARLKHLVCTNAVSYADRSFIDRDIAHLKTAVADTSTAEVFIPAVSPATLQILPNEYYGTPEEYTWALAEAVREEYRAIVDAGFILQIDDPALVDIYDWWFSADNDIAGYRKWARFQVEAVNHALEGIPEDRVRFHICWGSWHGPHSTDVPLKEIVDLLLSVHAQAYVIEAGNVRHEHEWKVWQDTPLPEGKLLIPGVASHATNVLEHPELVADRIVQYAQVVGRENVIAGTDCGLGGRVHSQIAWAKLRALSDGAAMASNRLWG